MATSRSPYFLTLGMFIIDEFSYLDDQGRPTGKTLAPQIGGGGTYSAIGARIWLPSDQIAMVVDRGHDFPSPIQAELERYGCSMWMFRDWPDRETTRALNSYEGEHRSFKYLTPRTRISPHDIKDTRLARSSIIHFICSPSRAATIVSEIQEIGDWCPTTMYEPVPDSCVPKELPALVEVLPLISVLSPNAEEALSLLSLPLPPTKNHIEQAAYRFLGFGIGKAGEGCIIIRSGAMGAFVATRQNGGKWFDAFWTCDKEGADKVVDVTGAGNGFLGGFAAGLYFSQGDVYEATFYASVSASFIVEQEGLPSVTPTAGEGNINEWNGDSPQRRLELLRKRQDTHRD